MDTGLHFVGFTRDKALEYFSKYAWDDTDLARKEVTNLNSIHSLLHNFGNEEEKSSLFLTSLTLLFQRVRDCRVKFQQYNNII